MTTEPNPADKQFTFYSSSSLRRLFRDCGVKRIKEDVFFCVERLNVFLSEILVTANKLRHYRKRKTINIADVKLAILLSSFEIHISLMQSPETMFSSLQKCNLKAPVEIRKESLLHAELSKLAFRKHSNEIANKYSIAGRIQATTRNFLQLSSEAFLMSEIALKYERGQLLTISGFNSIILKYDSLWRNYFDSDLSDENKINILKEMDQKVDTILIRISSIVTQLRLRKLDDRILSFVFESESCSSVTPSAVEFKKTRNYIQKITKGFFFNINVSQNFISKFTELLLQYFLSISETTKHQTWKVVRKKTPLIENYKL